MHPGSQQPQNSISQNQRCHHQLRLEKHLMKTQTTKTIKTITIDGKKSYPLWNYFVKNKNKWIGGTLEELSDEICAGNTTKITNITLKKDKNSGNAIVFTVHGKDFSNSLNVKYGKVSGPDTKGWLNFSIPTVLEFRIKKNNHP
jgi:hypothetical protein